MKCFFLNRYSISFLCKCIKYPSIDLRYKRKMYVLCNVCIKWITFPVSLHPFVRPGGINHFSNENIQNSIFDIKLNLNLSYYRAFICKMPHFEFKMKYVITNNNCDRRFNFFKGSPRLQIQG